MEEMKHIDPPKPTDAELEILQVLWENGACTVREVHDALAARRDTGYTTTLKLMQIMHEKGLVDREKDGRGHSYIAAVERGATQRVLLDRFVENTFGGSAMQLVMQALGGHKASPAEIDQIRAFLDQIDQDSRP